MKLIIIYIRKLKKNKNFVNIIIDTKATVYKINIINQIIISITIQKENSLLISMIFKYIKNQNFPIYVLLFKDISKKEITIIM